MLSWIDSENRNGSSGTMPTWSRRLARRRSRTSWPSTRDPPAGDVVEAGERAARGWTCPSRSRRPRPPSRPAGRAGPGRRGRACRWGTRTARRSNRTSPRQRRVDRPRRVHHLAAGVQDLVDAPGRRRRPLAHHDHHAEHPERRLQHQHVRVERDDRADRGLAVGSPSARRRAAPAPARAAAGCPASGVHRLRIRASCTYAQRIRSAVSARVRSCRPSAANALTIRTPWMFSSTTVASWASRAWISQETGKIALRMRHAEHPDHRHGDHRDDGQRHVDGEHQHERDHRDRCTAPGSTGRTPGTSARPGCPSSTATSARRTAPGRRSRTASGPGGRRRCCAGRTRSRTPCAAGTAGPGS